MHRVFRLQRWDHNSRAIIRVPALNLEGFSATLVGNPVSIRGVVADSPDPGRETCKGG